MDSNYLISSDNFIALFITIFQGRFLAFNKGRNVMGLPCCFNEEKLNEFIYYSKRDYRYTDFLRCFNFEDKISLELIIAINKARDKHLVTTIEDGEVYISKFYVNNVLNFDRTLVVLMESFVSDFKNYLNNTKEYLEQDVSEIVDSSRDIFNLKRKLNMR